MKRKRLAVFLTCCMTAGILAGCGGDNADTGSTQAGQESAGASTQAVSVTAEEEGEGTGEAITIEFFNQKQEEAAQQAYRNAAEEFHKEYPNIVVSGNQDCQKASFPETWDAFMELCQKLKDAGVQPLEESYKDTGMAGHYRGGAMAALFPDGALWLAECAQDPEISRFCSSKISIL